VAITTISARHSGLATQKLVFAVESYHGQGSYNTFIVNRGGRMLKQQYNNILLLWECFFKAEKKIIIFGFFATLLFSLISLITPFLTRFIVDIVFIEGKVSMLIPLIVISLAALLLLTIVGIITDYILVKAFQRTSIIMRSKLFDKLQLAPIEFVSTQRSGEIIYRLFNDVDVIEKYVTATIISLPVNLIFIIILSIILISWHWQLSIFAFIILFFQSVITIKFRKPILRYSVERKNLLQRMSGNIVENFSN